jgi:hypothetical protein
VSRILRLGTTCRSLASPQMNQAKHQKAFKTDNRTTTRPHRRRQHSCGKVWRQEGSFCRHSKGWRAPTFSDICWTQTSISAKPCVPSTCKYSCVNVVGDVCVTRSNPANSQVLCTSWVRYPAELVLLLKPFICHSTHRVCEHSLVTTDASSEWLCERSSPRPHDMSTAESHTDLQDNARAYQVKLHRDHIISPELLSDVRTRAVF